MIIIDRFEGCFAVLETDSGMSNVDRALLPQEAAQGDVLRMENGAYIVDKEAAEERRAAVRDKFRKLVRKNND